MSANYIRKTGNFKATNAVLEIKGDMVGFRPSYVKIVNESNAAQFEWFDGMGDDTGVKTNAAGAVTVLTADGMTQLDTGFSLAAVADINDSSGESLTFFALG